MTRSPATAAPPLTVSVAAVARGRQRTGRSWGPISVLA